jgi:hypothetical protein
MVYHFHYLILWLKEMVVDDSNLSLTKEHCSKMGNCPKAANFHSFTEIDRGL